MPKRKPPTKEKPPPKGATKTQRERFIKAARDAGVDETGEALERAFTRLVPPKKASEPRR
jgi:hypothetical protein